MGQFNVFFNDKGQAFMENKLVLDQFCSAASPSLNSTDWGLWQAAALSDVWEEGAASEQLEGHRI